ncbi:phage tail protein [Sporomusa sp.]|uniref:phage tail protein n=1 Tax=Sporomusa sp. TaxID=2078658 RepID=UPI002B9147E4|nr:phage tail protein [Sporomusa sp.]HWR07743.1 phage tail protein [Sporomusa sp.]
MSIGTFGPVAFEVSTDKTRTFDEFSRKTSAKIQQHDIVGLKPKLEFIAPGLDEISFQVIFSAFHGLNPLNEANQLREIVRKGEYHPLIIGSKSLGSFIIESLSEVWKHVDNRGLVLYIAIDLSLQEYTLEAAEAQRISTDTTVVQAQKVEKVTPAIKEQAKETGLSMSEIANLTAMAVNGVRDPALAVPAIQSILTATQKQQGGETYSSLGLDLAGLAVQSRTNPYGAITGTLDRLANTTADKPTAAKTIYGAKTAGSVLQIARQLKR